tara:strand:- start:92 stop:415 length:324 start_codon:yes stop_codon:yes gene_type:complete
MKTTDTIIATSNLTMGIHRDNFRLWIEGTKLFKSGFKTNDFYTLETLTDRIEITKDTNGSHKISGGDRSNGKPRPVIDRHDQLWSLMFPNGKITVIFEQNKITVRPS